MQFRLPIVLALLSSAALAQSPGYTPAENPVGPSSWWWNSSWWNDGQIPVPSNHKVTTRWIEYPNGDVSVPAMIARPDDDNQYPAVLYQHGRRGLDDFIQAQVKRLAARGFVVLAPDVFSGRFIEKLPIEHDYATETDAAAGIDVLLALPDVSTSQACIASQTRGGYITLKAVTTHGAQEKDIACYVSWYPHMQDPNAPEPMQVYRYAAEADQLKIPVLIFIGDEEQYQRRRSIETAVQSLQAAGKDARLVVYPGVGRGFDFRPAPVRTLADDMAAQDSLIRATDFINAHLADKKK
ncbi:MAG: dienelactone hydrolase family protein [Gammaproteobacteria bacterium]|nr:dienelactone hydrolase family protein [Gammaproteobacteria bacterium]